MYYCKNCSKILCGNNLSGYCRECFVEIRKQNKIKQWLTTGNTGMGVDTTVRGVIRDYILSEQNNCCAICGIPNIWNGQQLAFVLDHIDGDASHSSRDNLRLICPNCDSQLPTYKSRNKNSARNLRKIYVKNMAKLDDN